MDATLEQQALNRAPDATPDASGPGRLGNLPNGLSVDVEDYYHVEAFADRISPEAWSQYPRRVADNTRRVLELFSEANARATFFVLGSVAEQEPALLREIVASGHELGCHSHMHRRVLTMSPQAFREDLRRARAAIEDASGKRVVGYRAPTFSIVEDSLWAVEILAQEGFLYDSSVFPVWHDLYGMPHAPRFPFRWQCGEGRLLYEIPPFTVRILGRNWPAAGGGYLRILPMWYTRWAIRRVRRRDGQPAVVYFHPWEIDPGQPRISGSLKARFRHYSNLKRMDQRIRELLGSGQFVSLNAFLENHLAAGPIRAWRSASSGSRHESPLTSSDS
jgi:polysaccharide deacetylase family protein (PEP-CTERM system associated)